MLTRVGTVWCDGKKQDACVEFLADRIPGQALQPEGTLGVFPDKMEKGSTRSAPRLTVLMFYIAYFIKPRTLLITRYIEFETLKCAL